MDRMELTDRLAALAWLGKYINKNDERLQAHMHRAEVNNPWFTRPNIEFALSGIAQTYLDAEKLKEWTRQYSVNDNAVNVVGVVAAGNIPAVAFHDILSVFVSGNVSQIKYSDRDKYLIPFLLKMLGEIDPRAVDYFEEVDKLSDFDAVIATGSNNSARYFRQYFGKYPNIIRKNKNAVAVLDGTESDDELRALANDIFLYFGLGCRSVSHLYVPSGYDFSMFERAMETYSELVNHSKYKNNLDYHLAIHIINQDDHIALPNLVLVQNDNLVSPVGCLNYTEYDSAESLGSMLEDHLDDIQCIVGSDQLPLRSRTVPFGQAQNPGLRDYADGIDTMEFLTNLGVSI